MMGAGFIIYKKENDVLKFLGLLATKKYRLDHNGIYDIPKGRVDDNESYLDCAIRECYEEVNMVIDKNNVYSKFRNFDGLRIFISEYSGQTLKIKPNPFSNKMEHLGFCWCDPDFLYKNCFDYLKPCILWAKKELSL